MAFEYTIAFLGAFIAGGINTLAGNGSVITLSILTELIGLPGNLANGTNRIGVLFNGLGGTLGFLKGRKLQIHGGRKMIIPVVIGALAGVYIATIVSNEQFIRVFRILMIAMFVVLLAKPERWLIGSKGEKELPYLIVLPLLLILGFYGGFIQMGMGIFYLAILVLGMNYPLVEANAIKIIAVAIYTLLVVAIFQWKGLVDWKIGLLMGAGQFAGGWLTAHYAVRSQKANLWAFRLLVFVILLSLVSLFNLI